MTPAQRHSGGAFVVFVIVGVMYMGVRESESSRPWAEPVSLASGAWFVTRIWAKHERWDRDDRFTTDDWDEVG